MIPFINLHKKKSARGKIAFFAVVLLVVLPFRLAAQSVTLDARLDTTQMLIGDQIHLNLLAKQSPGTQVGFPVLADTLTQHVEVLSGTPMDTTRQADGSFLLHQQYLITSFDSGRHTIPALPFTVSINGNTDTAYTSPVELMVHTMPVDTTKVIKDVKAPLAAPLTLAELWPYILGAVILALVIWFIIRVIRQRKKKEPIMARRKPAEPAHVIALRELENLAAEKLWQNGKVKEYYIKLTTIIRYYIEGRFSINALERTSDEILDSFLSTGLLPDDIISQLRELLQEADLVKFAKASPLPKENEENIKRGIAFVEKTKPQPPAADKNDKQQDEGNESDKMRNKNE
ncbi:MAG TPA: hypothetical protein VE912_08315 [Bacteroidales bacterium]|nr:hypothetical protein [Bacteroidales bacterium]